MKDLADAAHIAETSDMKDVVDNTGFGMYSPSSYNNCRSSLMMVLFLVISRIYDNLEGAVSALGSSIALVNRKVENLQLDQTCRLPLLLATELEADVMQTSLLSTPSHTFRFYSKKYSQKLPAQALNLTNWLPAPLTFRPKTTGARMEFLNTSQTGQKLAAKPLFGSEADQGIRRPG